MFVHCTYMSVHCTYMFILMNGSPRVILVHPLLYAVCDSPVRCCTSFRQCYGTGICHLVHTVFRHVHTPQERNHVQTFKMMNMSVPCTDKFVQCTYNVHTLNVQVHVFMCIKKKLLGLGLELTTLGRPPGRPNHCASSVDALFMIVMIVI